MRLGDRLQSKLLGLLKTPHAIQDQTEGRGLGGPPESRSWRGDRVQHAHGTTCGWKRHSALEGVGDRLGETGYGPHSVGNCVRYIDVKFLGSHSRSSDGTGTPPESHTVVPGAGG